MTSYWREEKGKPYYRVQTDEKEIKNKLQKRKGFKLCVSPLSPKGFWVFICRFSRPDIAKKTIQSVTQKKAKIDSEGVFSFEE